MKKKKNLMLKNDTLLNGELLKAGTQIEATAENQELLKPFGYGIIESETSENEEVLTETQNGEAETFISENE